MGDDGVVAVAKVEPMKAAEEKEAAAVAALNVREERVADVDKEIAETKAELARIDGLDVVGHDQVVALENAKRKLRKLRGQREAEQAKVADAEKVLEAARLVTARERTAGLVLAMKADADDLGTFILGEVFPKLRERLVAHRRLVWEATSADQDFRMLRGTSHDAAVGVHHHTLWSRMDVDDPWEQLGEAARAYRAVFREREREQALSPQEREQQIRKLEEAQKAGEAYPYGTILVGPGR